MTVGSSPRTSSPTSASAMARRISGDGRVTVSLRRSISRSGSLIGTVLSVVGGRVAGASCYVTDPGAFRQPPATLEQASPGRAGAPRQRTITLTKTIASNPPNSSAWRPNGIGVQ